MSKVLGLLSHPSELKAAVELKFFRKVQYPRDFENECASLKRCYELLNISSRSFAAVIQELHPELRVAVVVFYLVLRGLDTIEDDTSLDNNIKLPLLRSFRDVLNKKDWTFDKISEKERDRVVLLDFDKILTEYHKLKPAYQDIIADITEKMGNGMAKYIDMESQKNYEGVNTLEDYDTYCHYVAGIVGEGLTRMAVYSKFGTEELERRPELHESMGLFLQKTNIIRDFREDLDDGRSFWPKEVWSKYVGKLSDFVKPEHEVDGLYCIADLTVHSLRHVIDCLEYLKNIEEPTLFSFCAIPQVMSIATLELLFNNADIFHRNVKIRRGTSAKLILQSQTMGGVYDIFQDYTRKIHLKNSASNPNFMEIEVLCGKIEQYIEAHNPTSKVNTAVPPKPGMDTEALYVTLAGIGGFAMCFSIMVGVAVLFGADFRPMHTELIEGLRRLWTGEFQQPAITHDEL